MKNKKIKMTLLIIFIFILIFISGTALFVNLSPQFGSKSNGESLEIMKNSINYKNGKFQNQNDSAFLGTPDFSTLKKFLEKGNKIPDWQIPVNKIPKSAFENRNDSDISVYWLGHSSILMLIGDKTILFDPVFSNTASPISFISPKRFSQKAIEISDLPHIDAIVISHDHYDHLDYKTIKELKVKTDKFFVPLGVAAHLISWGIEEKNISELAWRESTKFGEISFTAMPSQHFSGRGLNDRNSTLWCSWVIQYQDKNLFFGGDSGYDENVSREIGEKFGPFDLTILECGQYNEQWHAIHSFPEETAQANILLKGKYLLPIHWAAFKLSVHDWDEPINRISKASDSLNINLTTPKIGEAVEINKNYPNSKWWFK